MTMGRVYEAIEVGQTAKQGYAIDAETRRSRDAGHR
jgi:hypothetical protein